MTSAIEDYRLVASSLGLRVPALHALRKLAWIDHFYHLVTPIERLRFPRLRSDLRFAEATEADFAEIVRGIGALDVASRKEVMARVLFRRRAPRGCTIGRDEQGALVSMQWLVRPADDAALQDWFRARYGPLRPDEVLIENIFIFPRFRVAGAFPTPDYSLAGVSWRTL